MSITAAAIWLTWTIKTSHITPHLPHNKMTDLPVVNIIQNLIPHPIGPSKSKEKGNVRVHSLEVHCLLK